MEDSSFLGKILRLQRKTYDNPFMSILVQNVQDDDDGDESSDCNDDDDKDSTLGSNSEVKHIVDVKQYKSKKNKHKEKINKLEKDFNIDNLKLIRIPKKRRSNTNEKSVPAKILKTIHLSSSDTNDLCSEKSKKSLNNENNSSFDLTLPFSSASDYFTKKDSILPDKIAYFFTILNFTFFKYLIFRLQFVFEASDDENETNRLIEFSSENYLVIVFI